MKKYKAIVVDPFRGVAQPLQVAATIPQLYGLGLDDSLMFMWAGLGGSAILSGEAIRYMEVAGYSPLCVHSWHRVGTQQEGLPSMSPIGTVTSELFIIGKRGNPDLSRWGQPPYIDSIHVRRVPGNPRHKPGGFYRWIEDQTEGPYISVFTNSVRPGWDLYNWKGGDNE